MTLSQIIAELEASNEQLKAQSENFEQALADERAAGVEEGVRSRDQEIADMVVAAEVDRAAFGSAEYLRGFNDGVASDSEKIYTQAEMDQVKADADAALEALRLEVEADRASFQEQISSLNQQLADLDASIPGKVADAVAAFKSELKAKYDEMQVVETEAETGFGSLLS